MATLRIHLQRIVENIEKIDHLMQENGKTWSLVVKVLGQNEAILKEILRLPAVQRTHSIGVSQWRVLKLIKEIDPQLRTLYIKPPSMRNAQNVVRYADISFNSSFLTLQALDAAARKQGKLHNVIIMIEMGELREGIHREGLLDFYRKVFELDNIEVIGLGTNLGCMMGIQPTYDKLLQLVLYQQLIEATFQRRLELVSGASSITLPMLSDGKLPAGVNHFRIGEAAFLGTSPLNDKPFLELRTDTFTLDANIVELYRKSNIPDGTITDSGVGEVNSAINREESVHALVDFGALDVDPRKLIAKDKSVHFFGNSSDLTVFDLGENPSRYETGDVLKFRLRYMAVAQLMNATFVEKSIVDN